MNGFSRGKSIINSIYKTILDHVNPDIYEPTGVVKNITRLTHTSTQGSSTPAIDTTGADTLVVAICYFGTDATPVFSDTYNNTWVASTIYSSTRCKIIAYYALNAKVGAGHTLTLTSGAYNGSICFSSYKSLTSFGLQNGFGQAASGFTTIQPGSISPPAQTLVIAAWGLDDPANTTWAVDSGMTIIERQDVVPGVSFGCVLADLLNYGGGAIDPTFTRSNANTSGGDCAIIVSFS